MKCGKQLMNTLAMIWNIFAFFNFVSIITPPVLKIIEFPLQHLIAKWKEKRLLQNKFSTYVPGWCYNLSKQMCVCLCKGVSDLHVPYLIKKLSVTSCNTHVTLL